jgi:hypothetical protein
MFRLPACLSNLVLGGVPQATVGRRVYRVPPLRTRSQQELDYHPSSFVRRFLRLDGDQAPPPMRKMPHFWGIDLPPSIRLVVNPLADSHTTQVL